MEYILQYRKKIIFYLVLAANFAFIYGYNSGSDRLMNISNLLVLVMLLIDLSKVAAGLNDLVRCERIYQNECDPGPLEEEIEKQLATAKFNQYKSVLTINKALCLMEKGDLTESYRLLKSVDPDKCFFKTVKAAYYINLSDLYILMNKYNKALECLQSAKQIVDRFVLKSFKNRFSNIIEFNYMTAEILQNGKIDGAEEFFKNRTDKKSNNLMKCIAEFRLGLLYFNQNRHDEAKECFGYVTENGSKLYISKLANEYLKKL